MPFASLLLTSLKNDYRFNNSGVNVSYLKQPDEMVMFFDIDPESNPLSTFKQDLNFLHEVICDGLVFYSKRPTKIFCFVELKGQDINHAIDQVINTYSHFSSTLQKNLRSKSCHDQFNLIVWKAYIAVNSSSPINCSDKKKGLLKDTFGKNNFKIERSSNFSSFLRE